MNILVIGTRGIAAEVIKQGLEMGYSIRVLSRHPENLKITGEKLSIFHGDAVNPDDVVEASKNMDIIVSAIGIPPSSKDTSIFSVSAKNIITAVKTNNIKLLIAVTGIG